ncbi:MAG: MBL fold metallo-hydrolase [Rikenellaceae bacterium]
MQITIHRGIDQIGGCITEIATSEARVLIDLGQNLPDNKGNSNDLLATKEAIESLTDGVDAIFYTHYHGDHVGLFNFVPKDIPQYIGKVAKEVCICKHNRLGKIDGREYLSAEEVAAFERMTPLVKNQSVQVKDITITPYLVSHSAYESFMFLIEAEGKRILHTGDFRDHGYLGKGLYKVLDIYIKEVDVLITEGTMLTRNDKPKHESVLQKEFAEAMRQYKNVFVVSSSTDLDRLATIHSAHNKSKAGQPFVCDTFQKQLLDIFTASTKEYCEALFDFDDAITFESRTANIWNGFTMLIRSTDKYAGWLDKLLPKLNPSETCVIFSMWGEYINVGGKHAVESYLKTVSCFDKVLRIHTSGHASSECLAKVCTITKPRLATIPIHSERSADYSKLPISEELKGKIFLGERFRL